LLVNFSFVSCHHNEMYTGKENLKKQLRSRISYNIFVLEFSLGLKVSNKISS